MKTILERVISRVIDQKATGDILYHSSKSLSISSQNGEVEKYKVSSSAILGLRVIKDSRIGIAYTEATDDASLDLMVSQALQNAALSAPQEFERILDLKGEVLDEATYDEAAPTIDQKIQLALDLELTAKALDPRVKAVPYSGYGEGQTRQLYLSSSGRCTSFSDQSYSIGSSSLMEENGKKANFYHHLARHRFNELSADKVVRECVFHAGNILKEHTLATGKYDVTFSLDCLEELFGVFPNFFSAKSTLNKMNPFAGKLGSQVAASNLTILDDALFQEAFRINRFDSEGVETKPLSLIEDGVLKTFLHNSATAAEMKTHTTGHASRGAGSSLGVSGTHFIVQGKNPDSLPNRYLEIIQMDGLHSGANRVRGDFSAGVKGYVWENGERVQTFGNVTLSGNMLELLLSTVVTGIELRAATSKNFFSVPLLFPRLSVAGS